MKCLRAMLIAMCAAVAGWAGSGEARAQHVDVLTLQVNGQLVTGLSDCANPPNCTSGQLTLGQRVYAREFDSDFLVNNPGFNSPASNSPSIPAGSQALPPIAQLNWDFLPMQIGETTSDLYYWDGSDTNGQPGLTPDDVAFGALPGPSYSLTMFDVNSHPFTIHGSDQSIVPGGRVATTSSTGFIHQHNYFLIDDGSGYLGNPPADGIYLWAVHLRMAGLRASLPFVFVFGTLGSSVESLDNAAFPWLEQQLDLPGDYNGDGIVNAADYTAWRNTLNLAGAGLAADGSGNELVDTADYDVWKQHFGEAAELRFATGAGLGSMAAIGATGVPEPSSGWLLLLGCPLVFAGSAWRRRNDQFSIYYC